MPASAVSSAGRTQARQQALGATLLTRCRLLRRWRSTPLATSSALSLERDSRRALPFLTHIAELSPCRQPRQAVHAHTICSAQWPGRLLPCTHATFPGTPAAVEVVPGGPPPPPRDSEPQDSTGLFRDRAGARQEGVVASGRVSGAERVPARVEVIVLLARWVGSPEHRPAVAAVHQRNDAENGDGDQQSCYDSLARLRAARALRRRHSSDPLRSKVMRPSWREQTPQAPARSPAPSKTCKRW